MYLLWLTREYGIRAWASSAGTTKSFWGEGRTGSNRGCTGVVREAPRSGVGSRGGSAGLGTSLLPMEPAGPEQGLVGWVPVNTGWKAGLSHLTCPL